MKRDPIRPDQAGLVRHNDEYRYFVQITPEGLNRYKITLFDGKVIKVDQEQVLRHPAGTPVQQKIF